MDIASVGRETMGMSQQAVADRLGEAAAVRLVKLPEPGTRPNKTNRVKDRCPVCGIQAWGKPGLVLLCGADGCDRAPLEPLAAGPEVPPRPAHKPSRSLMHLSWVRTPPKCGNAALSSWRRCGNAAYSPYDENQADHRCRNDRLYTAR
ncbi:hypothetical protein GCM10009099_43970 [Caenispirillum bisanense]